MPRSSSRVTALAASLVCSVEKTKWPVRADWIAMIAVSRSRISPTMMTSGSCRRTLRKPLAKVMPFLSLTCVWLMPSRPYSMGSSSVRMLRRAASISRSAP